MDITRNENTRSNREGRSNVVIFDGKKKATTPEPAFLEGEDGSYVATRPLNPNEILAQAAEIQRARYLTTEPVSEPANLTEWLYAEIGSRFQEKMICVFLNARKQIITWAVPFAGGVNWTSVFTAEIARRALAAGASGVILAHNHPSGDLSPSVPDYDLTYRVDQALRLFDIELVEHLIVGADGCSESAMC